MLNKLTPQEEKNAIELLRNMVIQADEDTPSENRTEHFRTTMENSISFLSQLGEW